MTTPTLAGFLNKKEIEAAYGRSYRSLTRDITRAVKTADADVLRHLKLVTEDEQVREGTEVTLEMIQELSNNGLRPMWLAEESWVADWCVRRSSRLRDEEPTDEDADEQSAPPSPVSDTAAAAAPVPSAAVELLKQRVEDQKQQIDMLRGELQIKNEQIRNSNQLAEQSQQLMRELHVLLKNVQDGLLGEGSRRLITTRSTTPRPTEAHSAVIDRPAKPKTDRAPRRSAKPTARKKTAKRSAPTKPDANAPVTDRLQRWFPTFLGRKSKGK